MEQYNYETNPQGISRIKSIRMDYNLSRIVQIIDDKLKYKSNIRIFEPGCGGGRNLDFLKSKYGKQVEVYGSDISNASISFARVHIPGFFIVAKTVDDCFAGEFDLIIMLDILEHLSSEEEVLATIKMAQNKIDRNGILFISCPIELNKYSICWFFKKIRIWSDISLKYYGHTIQFTESKLKYFVQKYFTITNINYNVHFFTQISTIIFFYLPKQILNFFGGNNAVGLFRDSNIALNSSKQLSHKFMKIFFSIFIIFKLPFYYIGFYESKFRKKSNLGAMSINIECHKI